MLRHLLVLAPFAISLLVAALLQASMSRAVQVEPTPTPAVTRTAVVVMLTIGDRRIECLTRADVVSADELELAPEDAPEVIERLCPG